MVSVPLEIVRPSAPKSGRESQWRVGRTHSLWRKAHWMLREGAVAATPEQKKFRDAESMAGRGVELLKQRFVILL